MAADVDADLQLCGLKILVSTADSFIMLFVQRAMSFPYVIKMLFTDVSLCSKLFCLLMHAVINHTGHSLLI